MNTDHADLPMELYALERLHEAILSGYTEDLILFQQLTPDNFSDPTYKKLFSAMLAAFKKHGSSVGLGNIDDCVKEVLPDQSGYAWVQIILGAQYLGAPHQIVSRLNECLAMRKAMGFEADSGRELSGQFIEKGSELRSLLTDPNRVTDEQILENLTKDREVVATGYGDMDKMLGGGIGRGDIFVIAARTGVGKSAMGVNICARAIHAGRSAFFLTLEMPEEEVYDRVLRCIYGISSSEVKKNAKELSLKQSFRVSMGSARLPNVLATLQENAHHDILVVDYFQLIAAKGESQVQQLELVSNELKRFALDYKKPIIVLAQLNRNIESDRVNREPDLSDIRGCGALEQDASVVTFLWDANAKEERKSIGERLRGSEKVCSSFPEYWWIVRKNRNGSCGKFRLDFNPMKMQFNAVTPSSLPDL